MTRLTDDTLRLRAACPSTYAGDECIATEQPCDCAMDAQACAALAAELIERRAADAPFAVGDKVTIPEGLVAWTVSDIDLVRLISGDAIVYRHPSDLTPVPPAPTAAEVFEEEIGCHDGANWTLDAFRATCARLGIDPDAPIGEVG